MRIAINTRFLLKGKLEGIGWFTYEVVKRLVERHPEHEFIFLFDRPFDDSFIFGRHVVPVVLPPQARHPILFYTWFEWSVPYALKKHNVDLFISPDNFCSIKTPIPTLLVVHDIAFKHFPNQVRNRDLKYYNSYIPKYLKRADRILTVSEYTKQDIVRTFDINPAKIQIACNGVRTAFQPIPLVEQEKLRAKYTNGQPYFFYIGSVNPRKNVARLIQAFGQFKQQTGSSMKLLLAGKMGWKTSAVKSAYESAQYQADIIFLGYVDDELLLSLMGSAFALTYVSLFEGFGVPLLEAMHTEIPIITSDVSSMPEVVGEAGLLIDPQSINSISNAMIKLYNDPELCLNLVEKGRLQRQAFSWEKAVDVLENCINEMTAKQ